jgi:radical SAM superfamily enzyme YgiQ (UPF0313 family)
VRLHSADYVVREMEQVRQEYRPQSISFADDLFAVSKPRLRTMVDLMAQRGWPGEVRLRADVRANLVDEELVGLLRRLNVVSVSLGVESGSNRVLQQLKGTGVTVEKNWEAIAALNRADIGVYACFMMGAPDETYTEMLETGEFIRRFFKSHRFNMFNINPVTPLPQTKIWHEAKARGVVNDALPWEQFDFSLAAYRRRTYDLCAQVPRETIIKIIEDLFWLRRRKRSRELCRHAPWRLVAEAGDWALRRLANRCRHKPEQGQP